MECLHYLFIPIKYANTVHFLQSAELINVLSVLLNSKESASIIVGLTIQIEVLIHQLSIFEIQIDNTVQSILTVIIQMPLSLFVLQNLLIVLHKVEIQNGELVIIFTAFFERLIDYIL